MQLHATPQSSVPPHPSSTVPQSSAVHCVRGVQVVSASRPESVEVSVSDVSEASRSVFASGSVYVSVLPASVPTSPEVLLSLGESSLQAVKNNAKAVITQRWPLGDGR